MNQYPVIDANGHLASNEVWNVPEDTNEVRGSLKTVGMWSIPVSYRALAMDCHGRVFGVRTMSRPKESGYVLEGRVKIEGKTYRAFTSSKMFTRENGSLCDVAILYVCGTPDMIYRDPLTLTTAERREYLKGIQSRYHYDREGLYHDLARYCVALEQSIWPSYPHMQEIYKTEAEELRAKLIGPMGW